jgi:hypothetical protein
MTRVRFTLAALLTWTSLASSACTPKRTTPIEKAEFGVLFGGQVQERTEIPFELDTTRQALGFVITLEEPLTSPATLHWELSKPGPSSRLPDPMDRRVELFDAPLAAGQTRISKPVVFEPGDSLGLWNIRVVLGNHLAIDRSFMVYDPGSRRRKVREPVIVVDAGL